MEDYFSISYSNNQPESASLEQHCKDRYLGEGLKDICLYIRDSPNTSFSLESAPDGKILINWKSDPLHYRTLFPNEMVSKLQQMKQSLLPSENIEKGMGVNDFIVDSINEDIDLMIQSIEKNGVEGTIKKYAKKLDFLFQTIGKKIIVQNNLTVDAIGMSSGNFRRVMKDIYDHIPDKISRHFPYLIDFDNLTVSDR